MSSDRPASPAPRSRGPARRRRGWPAWRSRAPCPNPCRSALTVSWLQSAWRKWAHRTQSASPSQPRRAGMVLLDPLPVLRYGTRGLLLACDDVVLHAAPAQERTLGREDAGVDAGPADLPGQPAILDLDAAVHHRLEPRRLRLGRRGVVAHAELHPDHLDAELVFECDRLAHHSVGGGGVAEDIDDIDGARNLGQGRID